MQSLVKSLFSFFLYNTIINNSILFSCACIQRVSIEAGGRRSAGDLAPELSNIGLRPRRVRPETINKVNLQYFYYKYVLYLYEVITGKIFIGVIQSIIFTESQRTQTALISAFL